MVRGLPPTQVPPTSVYLPTPCVPRTGPLPLPRAAAESLVLPVRTSTDVFRRCPTSRSFFRRLPCTARTIHGPGHWATRCCGTCCRRSPCRSATRAVVAKRRKRRKQDRTECNPSVSTLTRRTTCILVDDEKKMKKILAQYYYYSLAVAAVAAVAGWHWYH